MTRLVAIRLLPVVLVLAAAGLWFHEVQEGSPHVLRNFIPLMIVLLLALVTLWRGDGRWTGSGWCWPLATAGFAIPALGLSIYLHYAYSADLNELFAAADGPGQLFRFLPYYTTFAGAIGFAIGWIVGRNL